MHADYLSCATTMMTKSNDALSMMLMLIIMMIAVMMHHHSYVRGCCEYAVMLHSDCGGESNDA